MAGMIEQTQATNATQGIAQLTGKGKQAAAGGLFAALLKLFAAKGAGKTTLTGPTAKKAHGWQNATSKGIKTHAGKAGLNAHLLLQNRAEQTNEHKAGKHHDRQEESTPALIGHMTQAAQAHPHHGLAQAANMTAAAGQTTANAHETFVSKHAELHQTGKAGQQNGRTASRASSGGTGATNVFDKDMDAKHEAQKQQAVMQADARLIAGQNEQTRVSEDAAARQAVIRKTIMEEAVRSAAQGDHAAASSPTMKTTSDNASAVSMQSALAAAMTSSSTRNASRQQTVSHPDALNMTHAPDASDGANPSDALDRAQLRTPSIQQVTSTRAHAGFGAADHRHAPLLTAHAGESSVQSAAPAAQSTLPGPDANSLNSSQGAQLQTTAHAATAPTTAAQTDGTATSSPVASHGPSRMFGPMHALDAVRQIALSAAQGHTRLDIQLEPAHLGKLHVSLQTDAAKQLVVHIAAEQSAAQQVIQQHLPQLRAALESQGMQPGAFSLSAGMGGEGQMSGQGGQTSHQPQPFRGTPVAAEAISEAPTERPTQPRSAGGRLSIRI